MTTIPAWQEFIEPIMATLIGGVASTAHAIFNVPPQTSSSSRQSGGKTWRHLASCGTTTAVGYALETLVHRKVLERVGSGQYKVTTAGLELWRSEALNHHAITSAAMAFQETPNHKLPAAVDRGAAPIEVIADAVR